MARSAQDPHLSFFCEQYDHIAHRTNRENFKLGNSLSLLGGVVKLVSYADEVTRELCGTSDETTVVMFGEQLLPRLGHCLAVLVEECGFSILDMQMVWVPPETAAAYAVPPELGSGRVVVVKCANTNGIQCGIDFMDRIKGAYAATCDVEISKWEQLLELAKEHPVAIHDDVNSTVVIVKSHSLQKLAGGVIMQQLIDEGLELSAVALRHLTSRDATELLTPYKGVLPDFTETVESLFGSVWVMQFVSLDEKVDVISLGREVCGPFDPTIAKELKPRSIRARFGVNRAYNAVHCCDLPEEGPLYANFFFKAPSIDE